MTDQEKLKSATWSEIQSQPDIWRQWVRDAEAQISEIRDWIAARNPQEVIFAGAGSSAYIGATVERICAGSISAQTRAVPTTDIVGDPESILNGDHLKLVVQFGRSGNSSETVGSLDILDAHLPDADRLNITCNGESALATRPAKSGEQRVIVLPDATHDKGFAMTSSFTTMLLTAQMVFAPSPYSPDEIDTIAAMAGDMIRNLPERFDTVPPRAIFLGTGALEPIARECALKTLELTAGQTMTSWDSTLGFRHGPKAAITDDTKVFIFIRNDPRTKPYDTDVANEIRQQFPKSIVTTVGKSEDIAFDGSPHLALDTLLYVLIGQLASVCWSAQLGLHIDDPFIDHGNLSRVVSGVKLYPFTPNAR